MTEPISKIYVPSLATSTGAHVAGKPAYHDEHRKIAAEPRRWVGESGPKRGKQSQDTLDPGKYPAVLQQLDEKMRF